MSYILSPESWHAEPPLNHLVHAPVSSRCQLTRIARRTDSADGTDEGGTLEGDGGARRSRRSTWK